MPSYDFVCQECGASFEVRLSMSAYADGEGRVCAKCGSTKVERAFTTVNVITGGSSGGRRRVVRRELREQRLHLSMTRAPGPGA